MAYSQETKNSNERVELTGSLSEFREALEDEILKIKKSGQSSTLLFDGRQVESRGSDFWYRFSVEYVPSLPADTPCKLTVGREQFDAVVVSFEDNSITISTQTRLPETLGRAKLENGAAILMERLIDCIEKNAAKENPAGEHMLSKDYSAKKIFQYTDLHLKSDNTGDQNKAIVAALSNDITFIWGPPGTGKTTVIGQIIDELYKHDRSVLVVSHTNTAVDGAIEKADKAYRSTNENSDAAYPILRIGHCVKQLPNQVTLEHHMADLGKELYEQKTRLDNRLAVLRNRIGEIRDLLAKDEWIRQSRLDEISEILQGLDTREQEIEKLRREIENTAELTAREKAAHPEYADYPVLLITSAEKVSEYRATYRRIPEIEKAISEYRRKLQRAQDELKKHAKYAELQAQEANYMSAAFLETEIGKAESEIARLQASAANLISEQDTARQVVSDYDRKSAVAKLFAGKKTVTQAEMTLARAQKELPIVNNDLRSQQALAREYSRQMESLSLIHSQMQAVLPSKTREFWSDEIHRWQSEIDAAQDSLKDLTDKRDSLYEELRELDRQMDQAKPSFDRIDKLNGELQRERDRLAKAETAQYKENSRCSNLLQKECSICPVTLPKEEKDNKQLYSDLLKAFRSVKSELASIDSEAIRQEKEENEKQTAEIVQQLLELRTKIQMLEQQAVMSARIVGATLAKSYLSDTLRARKFDTVILDEASMASIPALWCAAYLADKSIVIVGDFLQLPPIVMADTPMAKKWLGKDIFFHSGMQDLAKKGTSPENFVMLNQQFRMESDIADIANMYYGEYRGLATGGKNDRRDKEREKFNSWYPGKPAEKNIHLIDTENLHAWVTGVPQGKNHSRLNCFSAAVDVDLAFKFIENKLKTLNPKTAQPEKEPSVLIIAPYKPHVARVNQLIELEYRNRGFRQDLKFIHAGTIHSFQGSEADIVIFDLVVDEPHWKANLFMRDPEVNDDLRKMFNVAVTRARFKLYIVGNFAYCQKRAKNNALSELLDKLLRKDRLAKEDAKTLLPDIMYSRKSEFSYDGEITEKHIVCREESFNDYFMQDIRTFEKRLIIYSAFMTENRISTLLPEFADAIRAGKQIMVVTKALSDRSKSELTQYRKCEEELRSIGADVLHKKGMHEKLIFVDSKAVWIGSLNALSFTGLTGEIMQRHADEKLTAEYEKLFDIEHLYEAATNTEEQKCPICGGEMQIRESDEGGIYWQCVEGDYSRNADQQYPKDGLLRCKCGAPYLFSMVNEPRWVCSSNPKHYQKMRESDLKLDKMAALIPTKAARKKVDRFFAEKRKAKDGTSSNEMKTAKRKQKESAKDESADYQFSLFYPDDLDRCE